MPQDDAQDGASGLSGQGVKRYPLPATPGRSANMKANRRTDTKPELALRAALHARGYRYRKDFRLDLPLRRVRPDIAFTRRKVAVFIDGCFWHACPTHGSKPKSNEWYWSPKLARNVERDRAADEALTQAGWMVVRLWEHVPLVDAIAAVVAAVGEPRAAVGEPVTDGAGPVVDRQAGRPATATATIRPHARLPARHAVKPGRHPGQGGGRAGPAARVRGYPGAA